MINKSTRAIIGITINIAIILLAIFLIYSAGTKAFNFGNKVFNEEAIDSTNSAKQVQVTIESGVSVQKLADVLYANRLIKDKTVFIAQAELSEYKDKFKGGTYTLDTSMKASEIMEALCEMQTGASTEE